MLPNEVIEKIKAEALERYCTPDGKPNAQTAAYISAATKYAEEAVEYAEGRVETAKRHAYNYYKIHLHSYSHIQSLTSQLQTEREKAKGLVDCLNEVAGTLALNDTMRYKIQTALTNYKQQ